MLKGHESISGSARCNYCGSMSPDEALKALKKETVHASGSDWKYGWPHKFYIENGKFYSTHLQDANNEVFTQLTKLISNKLGIKFFKDENGIKYRAPYQGYQTWTAGEFDEDRPPIPENW